MPAMFQKSSVFLTSWQALKYAGRQGSNYSDKWIHLRNMHSQIKQI